MSLSRHAGLQMFFVYTLVIGESDFTYIEFLGVKIFRGKRRWLKTPCHPNWTSCCGRALVSERSAADRRQTRPPCDAGPPGFRSWEAALMRSPTGDLNCDDQDQANRDDSA